MYDKDQKKNQYTRQFMESSTTSAYAKSVLENQLPNDVVYSWGDRNDFGVMLYMAERTAESEVYHQSSCRRIVFNQNISNLGNIYSR